VPLILIRCPSCAKSSFSYAGPGQVARCSTCGLPLNGPQDSTATEHEIRERLYGRRSRFARPRVPTGG
jgi:ribosomal protein S27E